MIQIRELICDPLSALCHIRHYRRQFISVTNDVLYAIDRYYQYHGACC
ncbi:MAG: hypothetical protein JO139_16125 [Alphaproteobacteria bacterium]|nr:hypothetical protein [Alphaproteobacteria bacterium]